MKLVQTQQIFINGGMRVRLIFNKSDISLLQLILKLPDCKWSRILQDWHTDYNINYLAILNKSFPDHILFYDITKKERIVRIEEEIASKRIVIHNDQKGNFLLLKFHYDNELANLIKSFDQHSYDPVSKLWKIYNSGHNLSMFMAYISKMNYKVDFEKMHKLNNVVKVEETNHDLVPERFRLEMEQRRYNIRTIDQYISNVNRFLKYCGTDPSIDGERIKSYIYEISFDRNYSRSSQNQIINSIKVYFRLIYKREINKIEVPRPRRRKKLPLVLPKPEIEKIIGSISNLKHRTMLSTVYATGVRLDELLSLRPQDIDRDRKLIHIYGEKDYMDRQVPLHQSLETRLDVYCKYYLPKAYLFEGLNGKRYSARCLQKVLKKALVNAGINKDASIHTLRHSFALYLLESGMGLERIRELMGHASIKTTGIYTYIITEDFDQKKSPFNMLEFF